MKRKIKVIFSFLLACILTFALSSSAFAAESVQEPVYFIINDKVVISYGENYYNPETGEYFIWTTDPNTRSSSVAKHFTYKIAHSVTSSTFTVNSSKVRITSSAVVTGGNGVPLPGFDGTRYTVSLTGIYSRTLNFYVDGTETGTISGLVNGGSYSVRIAVQEYLPTYPAQHYLEGSGDVINI